MKKIPLTCNKVALVDDADYDYLNQWKWSALQGHHTFYAAHKVRVSKGKKRTEYMHRVILGLQPGDRRECDHRDGNGRNNRRDNLRICTRKQNGRSRRKLKTKTSRYKGVSWIRDYRKWRSQIWLKEKPSHLGYFDSETDAAAAYNRAASKCYGEFALINTL